jgi:hypothetical protein
MRPWLPLLHTRTIEKPAEKAVADVFGGIFMASARTSAVREFDWEGVYLEPDHSDVEVPVQILYAQGNSSDYLLQLHD